MKRYDFIKQFAIGGSILFTAPVVFSSCSKDDDDEDLKPGDKIEIDLEAAAFVALKTVGGYAYQGDIIIIRSGENQYMAFSKLCTHENFTVTYNHTSGNITCANHGSVFSNTGAVITGPATSALRKYNTTVSGSKLIIS